MRLPKIPPSLSDLLTKGDAEQTGTQRLIELLATEHGRDRAREYLHWDKLRRLPIPDGIRTHKEWWMLKKLRRSSAYRTLPFKSAKGESFVFWLPDPIQQLLHQVDQQASGRVEIAAEVANPNTRDRYLVSSLIEEAITSSQLEGASTTHRVAKAMLRTGRHPRDKNERMIFNNYRAMEFVGEVADQELTPEIIMELHQVLTDGTLDSEDAEGRYRYESEDVLVVDSRDNTILHEPPNTSELEQRMQVLCEFANSTEPAGEFLHPVVKSILLHFMIGYDHPFVDGNGRTARALFYWSMARHGYWMMEYVSISTILKDAPSKYARAYLHTETDSFDATYFIDFNLRTIMRAVEALQKYLARKAEEVKAVDQILGSAHFSNTLNHRQLALVSHALRNPGEIYSIESHRRSHGVSYPTARSDLYELSDYKLLERRKVGNAFAFRAYSDMQKRLEALSEKGV